MRPRRDRNGDVDMSSAGTHVILGGSGTIGRETAAALTARDLPVRAVSRSGTDVAGSVGAAADLLHAASTTKALEGAEVAYLTAGLPYSARVWQRDWPVILRNTIDACLEHGVRLVYFDNVYAYGRVYAPMTEQTPIRPSSKKGRLRAALLTTLEAAGERGLEYTVGRSADFYGPGATTSVFNSFAIDKVVEGKAPSWLFDSSQPHSMTYTPDIGAALAVLGTDPRALGLSWHLPTASALTGEDYLQLAAGSRLPHRTMSLTTMRVGALFRADARESLEMAYQYTMPYHFDSSAFETTFGLVPTPYSEGIAASIAARQEKVDTK